MDEIKKLYYNIGEAAERLQVKASAIRFWDDKLRLNLKMGKNGHRYFTDSDLELLNHVKVLRFEKKFTMEGTLQELQIRGLVSRTKSEQNAIYRANHNLSL